MVSKYACKFNLRSYMVVVVVVVVVSKLVQRKRTTIPRMTPW